MRLTTTQVGPLASPSATKISLSQKASAAGALAIDGAASTGYSANNIATSQTISGASAVTLNGSLAQGSPATVWLGGQSIVIVSAADDHLVTATVVGTDARYARLSEVVTLSNTSRVATRNLFYSITSITTSGSTTGNITVGTNGVATLDTPRRVLFTDGGSDTSITFTVYGTDWNNESVSEVVTGPAATGYTNYDFKTITAIWPSGATASTVTVGTNGVASSRPIFLDRYALSPTSLEVDVSGTVNWTVQQSLDDPSVVGFVNTTWINHPDTALVAATGAIQGNYAYIPTVTRVVLNSESGAGFITYDVLQASGTVL
jgi:hypothetical protein